MIEVTRARHIPAPPDAVFALLSSPDELHGLLPRVERVELLERHADHARIATHMAFGPFGSIRTEGDVRWTDGREIVFRADQFITVEARWTFTPANNGTDARLTLRLDLAPLLGPLAAFVPPERVAAMVAPDLDAALAAVAGRVAPDRA
jgi:carbon monoxide dehydrogenase subunit G